MACLAQASTAPSSNDACDECEDASNGMEDVLMAPLTAFDPRYDRHIEMHIIFKDDNYLVINKPYNIRVDGDTTNCPTVESTLYRFFPQYTKLYLCHQLDYATSGVHVWGLNSKAVGATGRLFCKRTAEKTYVAILRGHVKEDYMVIDKALARDPSDPSGRTMCIATPDNPGKASISAMHVLRRGYYKHIPVTLGRFKPKTGRQHQLRVHAASVGYPILGDSVYEQPHTTCFRMMLHALTLDLPLQSDKFLRHTYPGGLSLSTQDPLAALLSDQAVSAEEGARQLQSEAVVFRHTAQAKQMVEGTPGEAVGEVAGERSASQGMPQGRDSEGKGLRHAAASDTSELSPATATRGSAPGTGASTGRDTGGQDGTAVTGWQHVWSSVCHNCCSMQ